jgi:hypothetical protein
VVTLLPPTFNHRSKTLDVINFGGLRLANAMLVAFFAGRVRHNLGVDGTIYAIFNLSTNPLILGSPAGGWGKGVDWARTGLNRWPLLRQSSALPLSYAPSCSIEVACLLIARISSSCACRSKSETSSPKYLRLNDLIPVPAGINLPMVTFSFKP